MSSAPLSWQVEQAIGGRYYDVDGRPLDGHGRVLPHKFSVGQLLSSARDAEGGQDARHAFDRRVPSRAVAESIEDDELVATVECPCGEQPIMALGQLRECPGEECPRWYWFSGAPGYMGRRAVFVAFSPYPKPETAEPEIAKL